MTSAGFESNPFLWAADGRLSQAEVTFAWSWLVRGEWLRELVRVRADHANGEEIPRPPSFRSDDEAILSDLTRPTRDVALCKYLGQKQGDSYEPDPAEWHTSGSKARATVWYEWLHVTRGAGKEPHKVSISVNHLIRHDYAVPQNPLDTAAHAGGGQLGRSMGYAGFVCS